MTGISYKVTIDDSDMRTKLVELIARMEDAEVFYADVGDHLLNSVDDRFEKEEGPDGEKWKGLSEVTQAREGMGEHTRSGILWVSGTLKGSINREVDSTSVRIGSDVPYAAIQHFGGESKGYMKGAVIPPRPYLGLSAEDEAEILAMAESYFSIE
ncbi:phage virion morphogenesis protein [Shinella sp.]|jgi:phage virion morphogenesis protein|uniref:phage virion morphogenesis protein n=1 Tax=Shinella sp. TaxID=1870904 RepID=UPI003F6EB040